MATIDLSQFAVGGATRPDSFTGLDPDFLASLQAMIGGAPPEIQQQLRILSGFRSPERQAQLWQGALAKYGSPEAARKWVAPPGRSKHNHGSAVDLRYLDDSARAWAHENAGKFGMHFPLSNEPWHIEPIGSRGGPSAPQAPGTPAPAMGPGIDVADRPIAGAQPAVQAPTGGEVEGGLGAVLASLAPSDFSGMVPQAPQAARGAESASFGSGDPMGATMAAAQGAEKARGLASGLMPDVAALMGLGKKKTAPV